MMVGPAILFLLALIIARNGGGWFTSKDIWYFAVLAGMLVGRIIEFRGGDPRTADGEPATNADLFRYVAYVLPICLGVWVVSNLIGNR